MKGKNFTAAEKHFEKKRLEYEKFIRFLRTSREDYATKLSEANRKIEELTAENNQLMEWVDILLKYTEMSKEDVRQTLVRDQKKAEALQLFTALLDHSVYF